MIGDNFRMVMQMYVTSDEANVTLVINSPPMLRDTDIGPVIDGLYDRQQATMLRHMNGHYGVLDFRPMSHEETEAYLWGFHRHNLDLKHENTGVRH